MSLDQSSLTYKDVPPADSMEYRGHKIDFYEDPLCKQVFCIWKDGRLDFGTDNFNYKEEMKKVIDDEEDVITRFENTVYSRLAKLEKFQNGGYTDIRLIYRDRILKIWLNPEKELQNLEDFIFSAWRIVEENLTFEDRVEAARNIIYRKTLHCKPWQFNKLIN